jgi:predicted 3-demethylubiquinone-9 3-methyltransferase (glyoxalase superfamily)
MAARLDKIVPHLWYAREAEEAARFYTSIFPDSWVDHVTTMPGESPSGPAGSVSIVQFTLCGRPMIAMSAGPLDPFNHAISFAVSCDDQAELDRFWDALVAGGQPERCGWLRDKYGVCWQIVPRALGEMMSSTDRTRAARAVQAMMKMVKLDIVELKRAFEG